MYLECSQQTLILCSFSSSFIQNRQLILKESLELEDVVERTVVGLGILNDLWINDIPILFELLGQKSLHYIVMGNNGNFLVFISQFCQYLLELIDSFS